MVVSDDTKMKTGMGNIKEATVVCQEGLAEKEAHEQRTVESSFSFKLYL